MSQRSVNKCILVGNLTSDPQLRYTASGMANASFSLATNESWKDKDGEQQERVDYHNIKAWGKLAEICGQWLKKGKQVYVEGKIQTRSYEQESVKKYITEIKIDNMVMLGGKQQDGHAEQIPQEQAGPDVGDGQDPDLPF